MVPAGWELGQNYPNPCNPQTTIGFRISPACRTGRDFGLVRLQVYDLLGREVARLVDERLQPGYHTVQFNAVGLSSGVYVYRLSAGTVTLTRTMVLLR
jgi:hypothetical protein